MSLLPSRGPETSTAQEGELQVVGVDENAAPIFDALSSDTAREVLNAIYTNPGTPSDIADRLDMSIQKVTYHLENLEDVELIEVAGTRYSEKGQEMTVYEPPDDPMVLFVGTEERKRTLRSLVKRVVPTLGILALGSAAVQSVFGGGLDFVGGGREGPTYEGGGNGGDAGPVATEQPPATEEPAMDAEDVATEQPSATEEPTMGAEDVATESPTPDPIGVQQTGTPTEVQADTPTPEATGTPTGVVQDAAGTPTAVVEGSGRAIPEAATVLEPGVAFFLGGLFVLAIVGLAWYVRAR